MSSPLRKYEDFLVRNVSTISSVESALRSITWFLPGRFKDAELASESLSALLNVTSMYHDTVLARIVQNDPKWKPVLPLSLQVKYTHAWCEKDKVYTWAARALELIRFTQLFIEMGMRRRLSDKNRWRGIITIEAVKAILQIVLLKRTRRPLVFPPVPERSFDPASLPPPSSPTTPPEPAPSKLSASAPATPDHLKNNHVPLQLNPLMLNPSPPGRPDTSVEDYLLSKALTTSSVRPPLQLVRPLASIQDCLAEVVYILRPVIYVIMLNSGKQKGRALAAALALDLLCRTIRRLPSSSAYVERDEYSRRDRDIAWHLLRGPVWQLYTRPKLDSLVEKTANMPLLNLLGAVVKDWIPLIDEYYYYTAL